MVSEAGVIFEPKLTRSTTSMPVQCSNSSPSLCGVCFFRHTVTVGARVVGPLDGR